MEPNSKPGGFSGNNVQNRKQKFFHLQIWIICILVITLIVSSCQLLKAEPKLVWDPSPQAPLIMVSDPIQFPGILPTYQDERMENYLPEGVLFGDGRIQWVEYIHGGEVTARRVMEGYLSKEEIQALLQHFQETGYFGWKENYSGPFQEDGPPSESMIVYLRDLPKSVVVNNTQPPEGFRELAQLISSGAGSKGKDYMPDVAFLSAYPQYMDWTYEEGIQVVSWPAGKAGFTLAELDELDGPFSGQYVDGEALSFAWQVINANPQSPLVEEDGEIYLITLQIPPLSMYPLPEP